MKSKTYVIAHGAWTGAWGWQKVATLLREQGHKVHVPTLSGLCERSHLAKFEIDLNTHIDDIVNEMKWNDLKNVTLIGHSYGGIVATGVAEKMRDCISSIVYLDAFIPENGMSMSDFNPNWNQKGKMVPVPKFPIPKGTSAKARADIKKATPQPIRTMTQKLKVSGAFQKIRKKTYIVCTGWDGPFEDISEKCRKDPSWKVLEIKSGHDAPLEKPKKLVKMLLDL